jgi:hypothetical protein
VGSRGVAKVVREQNGTYQKLADTVQLWRKPAERSGVVRKGVWLMINLAWVWTYFFLIVGLPVARFCLAGGCPLSSETLSTSLTYTPCKTPKPKYQ